MCGSMGIHLFLCMLGLSCFLSHKWEYTEGDVRLLLSEASGTEKGRGSDRSSELLSKARKHYSLTCNPHFLVSGLRGNCSFLFECRGPYKGLYAGSNRE